MSEQNIHALPVGHVFEGYRIIRVLGAGGFGITYLAEETTIGRKVAIKEFLPSGFAARETNSFSVRPISETAKHQFAMGLDRFRKEAATLVNFEHRNIVAVHRYFETNGTAYLVMQYVDGKPLNEILAGGKTLTESEIEEVINPILDGLEQVHAAHFLHRDIKPANIYIRKDGRPVLLDFGAARQAFGSETKSITAIVSEGYAPFEQYEARGDQGPWTDIYGIGAVLYRCIVGERPPGAPERISARVGGAADPMVPAREYGHNGYSAKLLAATDRALGMTRSERPQNIGELQELLRGRGSMRIDPISRSPPSAAPHTMVAGHQAPKPRRRLALAAGIAALLAAGAAGAYFAFAPDRPSAPSTAAAPSSPPTTMSSPPPAPAPPSAEQIAERAAQAAAEEAAGILESAKSALAGGDFERARDEMRAARRRVEEAMRRRPGHAALERVLGSLIVAEADLGRRIAARVKELTDAAEHAAERGNDDEAQRLIVQAERLDAAAAKAARERMAEVRRRAEADRARGEAERKRQEEARRQQEEQRRKEEDERRAQEGRAEAYVSLARQRLEQARAMMQQSQFQESRRLADDCKALLGAALQAYAASASAKALGGELDGFQRDLSKAIAEHVATLLRRARDLIGGGKLEEAQRNLDDVAELDASSAELANVRRLLDAERKKSADSDRQRRDDEERKKREAEALVRLAIQRLDQAKAALQQGRYLEARRLAQDCAALIKSALESDAASVGAKELRGSFDAFDRDLAKRIADRVALLIREVRALMNAEKLDEAERKIEEAAALDPASAEVTAVRSAVEAQRRKVMEAERLRREEDDRKRRDADALARLAGQRLEQAKIALQQGRFLDAKRLAADCASLVKNAIETHANADGTRTVRSALDAFERDLARRIADRVTTLLGEARQLAKVEKFDEAERKLDEAAGLDAASTDVAAAKRALEGDRRKASDAQRQQRESEERKRREADALAVLAGQRLDQAKASLQQNRYLEAKRLADDCATLIKTALETHSAANGAHALREALDGFGRELAKRMADRVAQLVREARELLKAEKFDEAERKVEEAAGLEPASSSVADIRRALQEERSKAAEAARRQREESERKQREAEALAKFAGQRLDQARTALDQGRYAEARRLTDDAASLLKEAIATHSNAPMVAATQRDIEAFRRDLGRRIGERVTALLRESRDLVKAGKLDEARRRIDDAAELEPASAAVTGARREHELARKQADEARVKAEQDRQKREEEASKIAEEERRKREVEARKKEEEDRRKREEEARKAPDAKRDPDAEQREKTKGVVRDPFYDARNKRGAAYFAFEKAELSVAAAQALGRATDAAKADQGALLSLVCGYDQLEEKDPAAGRKLAQERCQMASRAAAQRGLPTPRIRAGIGGAGKGPEFRRVAFAVQPEKPPNADKPDAAKPETPTRPGALQLTGRTGSFSRLSPERRAVMRIHLQFGAGGTLGVSCVAELADGGQAACFGQPNGTGTWSLNGSTLCLASAVINLPSNTCYQVSGGGNQLVLAGPGILAGVMFLR